MNRRTLMKAAAGVTLAAVVPNIALSESAYPGHPEYQGELPPGTIVVTKVGTLLDGMFAHVRATGEEILCDDLPRVRLIRFAAKDKSWAIDLGDLKQSLPIFEENRGHAPGDISRGFATISERRRIAATVTNIGRLTYDHQKVKKQNQAARELGYLDHEDMLERVGVTDEKA